MFTTYKNWSFLFFICAAIKFLILSITVTELGLVLVMASLVAFFHWKENNIEIETIKKRCDKIDNHLTQLYKNDEEFKTTMSSLKLGSQVRNFNVGNNR